MIKSEKGSVTLFVLIAVLFFSVILLTVYNKNISRLQTQDRDILKIQEAYQKDANQVYNETVKKLENNTTREWYNIEKYLTLYWNFVIIIR